MIILESKGKYQVLVFGEWEAGRVVRVLMAGSVPIAFVDHDKRTTTALRVLSQGQTTAVSAKKFDEYTEKFMEEHGKAYDWKRGWYADWTPPVDWIRSLVLWDKTLNQAIGEACAAAREFSDALAYHARNS